MAKILTKDPYAFNCTPLAEEVSFSNTGVLSNEKDSASKAQKQFYIESYDCML